MSVGETLLLFSIPVPSNGDTFAPKSHQIVALIVGSLLIPGLAVILSCLNYGAWWNATLRRVDDPTLECEQLNVPGPLLLLIGE